MLEPYNVSISVARSGIEAIQKVAKEEFDVILLDLLMPDMDGIETAKEICRVRTGVTQPYIVATTGMSMDELNETKENQEFADILKKPLQKYELKQCLEQWFSLVNKEITKKESEQDEKERSWKVMSSYFKDIKEVDMNAGQELTNGNVEFFTRILKTSIPSLQRTIEVFQECIAECDSFKAHQQLHAIKSVFAYIGASALAMEANRQDMVFQQKDGTSFQERYQSKFQELELLTQRIVNFLNELEQAMNAYNNCIQRHQSDNSGRKLSESRLLEQMDQVLYYTEHFEYIEIVRGLQQLSEIAPKHLEDMIQKAMVAMEEFDYEEVAQILNECKCKMKKE